MKLPYLAGCLALVILSALPVRNGLAEDEKSVAARPSGGSGGKAGTFGELSLNVQGIARTYRLIVPASVDLAAASPIVFAFHGFLLDSKDFMARYTEFGALAEKEKFVVVFPQGLERRWEILGDTNRDIVFFDALLEHLKKSYNLDLNRVYATGMSNGGYFSNLLAAKRSDVIAAIAPHSSGMGVLGLTGVKAKRKYAVLVIHGTADNIVPLAEGVRTRDLYKKEGHVVEYEELKGHPHFWGNRFDVNSKIWEFFKKHPMEE